MAETEMVTEATETEAEAVVVPVEETKPKTEEELKQELERLQRTVNNKTEEAARVHEKLAKFEEEERKRKEAEMSELEKAQAALKEAENKALKAEESARMRAIEAEVIGLSATLEFADPKDALALIDLTKVETTDGQITGVKEQLETLAKSKPYLLKSKTNPSIRATNAAASQQGESDAERRKRLGIR